MTEGTGFKEAKTPPQNERWQEILAVAARLFSEKGYIATTMDDIAAELHVTKPALYYYIKTKHDLLYEICEKAVTKLMEGAQQIDAGADSAERELRELIRWHVRMFAENGDILNVYLADEGELPPDKRDHIRSMSREYEHMYRRILRRGIDEGLFREMDVPMTVRAISGMCNWLSNWYRTDGDLSAGQIADIFLDFIMGGIKTEPD